MKDILESMGFSEVQVAEAITKFDDVNLALEYLCNQPSPSSVRKNKKEENADPPNMLGLTQATQSLPLYDKNNKFLDNGNNYKMELFPDDLPPLEELSIFESSNDDYENVANQENQYAAVFCTGILKVIYSIPALKKLVLFSSENKRAENEMLRCLRKFFIQLNISSNHQPDGTTTLKEILPYQLLKLDPTCSTNASKLFISILEAISTSIEEYRENVKNDSAAAFYAPQIPLPPSETFISFFGIKIREHLTPNIEKDASHENCSEQDKIVCHFEWQGGCIYDAMDQLFFPNTVCISNNYVDRYRTIEERYPSVLSFSRVHTLDVTSCLTYQKTLYIDRYVGNNLKDTTDINNKIELLKEQKRKIQQKMVQLDFHDIPVEKILYYAKCYVEKEDIGARAEECAEFLGKLRDEKMNEMNTYKQILHQCDEEISLAWSHTQTLRYEIHAIITKRDCNDTTFTYVRDHNNEGIWWKMSVDLLFNVNELIVEELFGAAPSEKILFLFYVNTTEYGFMKPLSNDENLALLPSYAAVEKKEEKCSEVHEEVVCGSQKSGISLLEFIAKVEEKTSQFLDEFKPEPSPVLNSFSSFLLNVERVDLLQYKIADDYHKEYFLGHSLTDNVPLKRKLKQAGLLQSASTFAYTGDIRNYRKLFDTCVEVVQYYCNGCIAFEEESYSTSLLWLRAAWRKNKLINLDVARRTNLLMNKFDEILLFLSEVGQEKLLAGETNEGLANGKLVINTARSVSKELFLRYQNNWNEFKRNNLSVLDQGTACYFFDNLRTAFYDRTTPMADTSFLNSVPLEGVWELFLILQEQEQKEEKSSQ